MTVMIEAPRFTEEELRYYNFMSMMSYSDYMIFEEDVRAGRRDINEPYAISWR